jgi:hypothetical protein
MNTFWRNLWNIFSSSSILQALTGAVLNSSHRGTVPQPTGVACSFHWCAPATLFLLELRILMYLVRVHSFLFGIVTSFQRWDRFVFVRPRSVDANNHCAWAACISVPMSPSSIQASISNELTRSHIYKHTNPHTFAHTNTLERLLATSRCPS